MGSVTPLTGDFAVRQVLEAEREAHERIASARQAAEQLLDQARADARAIEQHAVEVTRTIQQRARHFGEQRLARLERETQRLLAQAQQEQPDAVIDALARRFARELIGAAGPGEAAASAPDEGSP